MSSLLLVSFNAAVFNDAGHSTPVSLNVVWHKHIPGTHGIGGFVVHEKTGDNEPFTLYEGDEDRAIYVAMKAYKRYRAAFSEDIKKWQEKIRRPRAVLQLVEAPPGTKGPCYVALSPGASMPGAMTTLLEHAAHYDEVTEEQKAALQSIYGPLVVVHCN